MKGQAKRQNGIALITVLWLLLLLSVIAAGVLRDARSGANLTRNAVELAKARALAEAGIQRAQLALSGGTIEAGWRTDGTGKAWSFAGGRIEITIQDEAGRIDLNRAPIALLQGLLRAADLDADRAAALAAAIADFRDRNDLRRLNGAEDGDYNDAGLPWGAKDAPFDRVDEVGRVLGFTPSLLSRIRPAVTVYSGQAGIDLSSAPRDALLAVPGVDALEVEAFLERRRESAQAPVVLATAADQFVSNGRSGRTFEVRAAATDESGTVFTRTAVLRTTGGNTTGFRIVAWN